MLALRTSPLKDKSPAPAQELMKRTLHTNLPNTIHNKLMKIHRGAKNKELQTLKTNSNVRLQMQGNWNRKGKRRKKLKVPRLYFVQTKEGRKESIYDVIGVTKNR